MPNMLAHVKLTTIFVAWTMFCGGEVLATDNLVAHASDHQADWSVSANGRQLKAEFEPESPYALLFFVEDEQGY